MVDVYLSMVLYLNTMMGDRGMFKCISNTQKINMSCTKNNSMEEGYSWLNDMIIDGAPFAHLCHFCE